jgi:hypothetical protein
MNISELFSFSRAKWQNDIVPFPTELKEIQLIKILHLGTKKMGRVEQTGYRQLFILYAKRTLQQDT